MSGPIPKAPGFAGGYLPATHYPTAIRSTGVGWALGIGRIGSIIGPLIGGAMLVHQVGVQSLFKVAAIPALVAAAASLLLARIE